MISEHLKKIEDAYSNCVKQISDDEFSEKRIEDCTGKDFLKVIIEIRYESLRVMSKAETKIRQFFEDSCYSVDFTNIQN